MAAAQIATQDVLADRMQHQRVGEVAPARGIIVPHQEEVDWVAQFDSLPIDKILCLKKTEEPPSWTGKGEAYNPMALGMEERPGMVRDWYHTICLSSRYVTRKIDVLECLLDTTAWKGVQYGRFLRRYAHVGIPERVIAKLMAKATTALGSKVNFCRFQTTARTDDGLRWIKLAITDFSLVNQRGDILVKQLSTGQDTNTGRGTLVPQDDAYLSREQLLEMQGSTYDRPFPLRGRPRKVERCMLQLTVSASVLVDETDPFGTVPSESWWSLELGLAGCHIITSSKFTGCKGLSRPQR